MSKMKLGISACPNDTFMFEAMLNKRLKNTFNFDVIIEDIEKLNKLTLTGELDISKISFANYPEISKEYQILNSGCAVGYKNGPLIISKNKIYPDELKDVHIAIPGVHTTANLLMEILFPEAQKKYEYLFSDIEEAVLENEMDAGLIIHETRFTYGEKGLKKVEDLGEKWENDLKTPVPLGGIVIKRDLPFEVKNEFEYLLRSSIEFAMNYQSLTMDFVRQYARELKDSVILQHIDLYVNHFSLNLGKTGQNAIHLLFNKGVEQGLFSINTDKIFLNSFNK